MKKEEIIKAEQQFLGFALGNQGYPIEELVSSMGLTNQEWDYLKKEEMVNNLTEGDIEDVDNYFKGFKK